MDWKDSPCRPDTRFDHLLLYRCRMPAVRFRDGTEDKKLKWQVLHFHKQRINEINQLQTSMQISRKEHPVHQCQVIHYLSYGPKHVSRGFTFCPK